MASSRVFKNVADYELNVGGSDSADLNSFTTTDSNNLSIGAIDDGSQVDASPYGNWSAAAKDILRRFAGAAQEIGRGVSKTQCSRHLWS